MGIFLVFSVMSFVALILGRRGLERGEASVETGLVLERTGAAAALMPLLFAVYLAAVPRLGRGSGAAVRVPAPARRGPARDRGRPARGVDARDRRAGHAARVRDLAWQVSERRVDDGHALQRVLRACSIPAGADDRRAAEEAVRGRRGCTPSTRRRSCCSSFRCWRGSSRLPRRRGCCSARCTCCSR